MRNSPASLEVFLAGANLLENVDWVLDVFDSGIVRQAVQQFAQKFLGRQSVILSKVGTMGMPDRS